MTQKGRKMAKHDGENADKIFKNSKRRERMEKNETRRNETSDEFFFSLT